MTYTVFLQDVPQRNRLGDFEAKFIAVGTVEASTSTEAWTLARQQFPKVRWPVIERMAT